MTDVAIHYYDATAETWVDLTDLSTAFHTEDWGIQKVGSATVNLEGARSDFTDYLSNPHRLIRIQAKPAASYQNLFFGYVDEAYVKTLPGTIVEQSKISLDCLSFEARLAQDYITFNYYDLMSAEYPHVSASSWTFRKMLNDLLAYPDSRDGRAATGFAYGTGFTVDAATDASGIDRVIDGTGNWDNQTLFEAVRLACEHIGYDGYYNISSNLTTTTAKLYPFNKASIATLTNPFIGEPEYRSGSLADVANIIFVEGGVDRGIPSDGDRWTEYAATKYSPAIWTATHTGASPTVEDVDNTVFQEEYRANSKCIKVSTTGSTNQHLHILLNVANTSEGSIDAVNRISSLIMALKTFTSGGHSSTDLFYMNLFLYDGSGNKLLYRVGQKAFFIFGLDTLPYHNFDFEEQIQLSIGAYTEIKTGEGIFDRWVYSTGTTFDWEHVTAFEIQLSRQEAIVDASKTWGVYIDALQFGGGAEINQFHASNPPATDASSISSYGVHPYKHVDSQISSFELAQAEAARVLNNLHTPIPTLNVSKIYGTDSYGTTWSTQLRPSNVVTCQSVDWRVLNVCYDWKSKQKLVAASYKMVGKTSALPPIWSYDNALRYLMK